MKKVVLVLAFALVVLILFFWFSSTKEVTLNPSGGGIVEDAYEYCSQFYEGTCNSNQYVTEDYFEPIGCYWNLKVNSCWAGIGYQ